jgi:hypothetical protein
LKSQPLAAALRETNFALKFIVRPWMAGLAVRDTKSREN